MRAGTVRVGISGWIYAPWRGDFYPTGLPHRRELEYAAERLDSIEINGSFYSLQRPISWAGWRDRTPDDFVFAVKGGRFITHLKRLADVDVPMANFFASGPLLLAAKLGPFLWQLPANLPHDTDRLHRFLSLLPATTSAAAELAGRHDDRVGDDAAAWRPAVDAPLRHALEARHPSFVTEDVLSQLAQHGVAAVVADSGGRFPAVATVTSDFVYVRLHGPEELYSSGYDDQGLDRWAVRVAEWADSGHDVFVYFDNDAKGYAPFDAMRLRERLTSYLPR